MTSITPSSRPAGASPASDPISQLLARKEVLLADGAMGTNLFALGLTKGSPGELWNVERPEDVLSIYRAYVDAGSDIILTNTFSANRFRFGPRKLEGRVRELNVAGVELARSVADKAGRPVIVAGSIGPTGELLDPFGPITASQAEEAFHEQAEALREGGVHVAWIESMSDENELEAAVRAVQRAGLQFVATMTFDTRGHTMMGVHPTHAIRQSRNFGQKPVAFGANCGVGPAQLLDSVLALSAGAAEGDILVAKSNCGLPIVRDDMSVVYNGSPAVMRAYARLARDAGARIIGGCCGTTPVHIRAMAEALAGSPKGPVPTFEQIERELGPIPARTTSRS